MPGALAEWSHAWLPLTLRWRPWDYLSPDERVGDHLTVTLDPLGRDILKSAFVVLVSLGRLHHLV